MVGSRNQRLKDLRRPIIVFYENFPIPKLFEELLLKKEHFALIINEYGGMQGLATMEDIIETLLGLEIMDEKDIEVNMQELAKKKWDIRPEVSLEYFHYHKMNTFTNKGKMRMSLGLEYDLSDKAELGISYKFQKEYSVAAPEKSHILSLKAVYFI